jgi:hypothetical protein
MEIRIRQTGAVVYDSEFRTYAQTQGAVFGTPLTEEFINQYGGDIVLEGPQATTTPPYQYSQRAGVEQLDGKWYTKYIAGPVFTDRPATDTEPAITAAEQEAAYKAMKDTEQAKSVRTSRDDKLKETDWRYRRDQTTTPEWDAYCQALRDVPAQAGFPWTINWPVQP